MNLNHFFTEEIKEYIFLLKEKEHLSNYQYINLIALLLTQIIITRKPINNKDINYFNKLISLKSPIINNNSQAYNSAIEYIVNNYFTEYGISKESFNTIINNWFNGYLFHSLNNYFISSIDEKGICQNHLPWDIEEISKVRKILNKPIFGLFNGRNKGIFFTTNLKTSPYYALTSPTYFRKFIENKPEYLNTYLNRDLSLAHQSIEKLCQDNHLTIEDQHYIINFFKKNWLIFDNKILPSVLLKKRNTNISLEYPCNNVVKHVIELIIKDDKHVHFTEDIARENLIIFSYDSLETINNYINKKTIN